MEQELENWKDQILKQEIDKFLICSLRGKIKFSTIFQYRVQFKFLNSIFLVSIFKFQNIKVSLYAAQKAAFYDLFLIMKPYR